MNKKPFGLDIGASTIKVVWLDGNNNSNFVLKAAAMVPTPLKGMLSQSPLDEEEMSQIIRKTAVSANIDSKEVNVALAENQVYTKVLEMPILSDRELRSAIYWEAEQYIPVPLANITLTWNVLDRPLKPQAADKMVVLMVGAPTTLVAKYQKVISMAGLTINSMETEILATVRSLVWGENFPSSIIVNIGAVSTSFAIIRNSVMVFTYSMSVGGSAINHAIASDFGFTPDQAEEYKKVYGVSGKALGGKIGQVTTPILNAIVVEIKKSLAYYLQKYKDLPIRQIIIAGGTANLPGIDLFFANNCGVETVVANPWKILSPSQIPQEILQNGADYTIAVGLAIRNNE